VDFALVYISVLGIWRVCSLRTLSGWVEEKFFFESNFVGEDFWESVW